MNTLGMLGFTTLFSGNWNNSTNTGTFNWNLNDPASAVFRNIGTLWCDGNRLSKKYVDPLMKKEVLRL